MEIKLAKPEAEVEGGVYESSKMSKEVEQLKGGNQRKEVVREESEAESEPRRAGAHQAGAYSNNREETSERRRDEYEIREAADNQAIETVINSGGAKLKQPEVVAKLQCPMSKQAETEGAYYISPRSRIPIRSPVAPADFQTPRTALTTDLSSAEVSDRNRKCSNKEVKTSTKPRHNTPIGTQDNEITFKKTAITKRTYRNSNKTNSKTINFQKA